jgi:hypothetical protein
LWPSVAYFVLPERAAGSVSSSLCPAVRDFRSLPMGLNSQKSPFGGRRVGLFMGIPRGRRLGTCEPPSQMARTGGELETSSEPGGKGAAAPPPGSHSSVRPDRPIPLLSELRPKALQGATAAKG